MTAAYFFSAPFNAFASPLLCQRVFQEVQQREPVQILKGPRATEPGYILVFEHGGKKFFKPIDLKQLRTKEYGDYQSPINEVAAYVVSEIFSFELVPETYLDSIRLRKGQGLKNGSLQKYIEGETAEHLQKRTGIHYGEPDLMWIFDKLIANIDRSSGNYILDADKRWWAIDNAKSFFVGDNIKRNIDSPEYGQAIREKFVTILRAHPHVIKKLRTVSDAEVRKKLKGLLTPREISSLLERRRTILSLLP